MATAQISSSSLKKTMSGYIPDDTTVVVLTFNEQDNIERTLSSLSLFKKILIIDSGSSDNTVIICRKFANTRLIYRKFDSFAEQCNFAIDKVDTEWILSIDADYVLSEKLVQELSGLEAEANLSGYAAQFEYCIYGRKLRGSLYPPRTVLYRKSRARYENEGHGHRVRVEGEVRRLRGTIYHDDRKSLRRWFSSQIVYAEKEANHLLSMDRSSMRLFDKLRTMVFPAPAIAFFYVLIIRGCIFDGPAGWFYAFQRLMAEILIALELIDRRLHKSKI